MTLQFLFHRRGRYNEISKKHLFLFCMTKIKPLFTAYSVDVLTSNSLISSEKAWRELGYSPRPIRESVADAIQWFKENDKL